MFGLVKSFAILPFSMHRFAKTVAIALGIADQLTLPAVQVLGPTLAMLLGKETTLVPGSSLFVLFLLFVCFFAFSVSWSVQCFLKEPTHIRYWETRDVAFGICKGRSLMASNLKRKEKEGL